MYVQKIQSVWNDGYSREDYGTIHILRVTLLYSGYDNTTGEPWSGIYYFHDNKIYEPLMNRHEIATHSIDFPNPTNFYYGN